MGKKNRKQVFFDEDTPHGLVKRLMFKKYFQAYIEKTQNEKFNLKTVYIDGFAGVGRYGNEWPSEIEKYGSPLIALMVSLGFYYRHDMLKQKEDKKDKPKMPNTHETDLLENSNQETVRSKTSVKAGNKSTETSGEDERHGQPTNTQRKEDSIWGWSTSELEPEDELPIELEKRNKRSKVFGENANITLHFIESDIEKYRKLAANVELLIMKFLERHYPEYTYGFRQMEGNTLFKICTGSFNLTVKVFHQEFAKTTAPPMLRYSSVRSLTFLDPYGFKDTPMAHVQQFVPGSGNEILINFMSSFVNRFVSKCPEHVTQLYGISLDVAKYYGIDPSDLEDSKDELVEFVKFVIHFCQPEREFEFSNKIQKCTSNYEAFLKRKTQCKFSLTFELKDKRNTTLFHMVHVTNHRKGIEAMKESMNRCSQKEGKMVMSDYDVICKGQNLNFVNMDDNEKVAEMIYSQFRGKERVPISDIDDYVLLDTNYVFRKRPLNILQKSGKITTAVDDLKRPQKRKDQFPDRDIKTKQKLIWYISFADEEYRSESADGPDVGVQNLIKEVKKSKKKSAKKNQNKTDMPSSTRTEEQEDKIEKEVKKTKENKGNGNKRGLENELNIINEKPLKRQKGAFRDINTNINGATPLLVTEIDKGANEPEYGSLTHEQKEEGEVEKDNRIKAIRQSSLTDKFKVLKRPQEMNAGEVHKQEGHKRKKSK